VVDHDATPPAEGGIKRWVKLAEATGLDPRTGSRRPRHSSRHPLRSQRISEYRSQSIFAGSGRFLAYGIIFRQAHYSASGKTSAVHPWLSGGLDYFEARLYQGSGRCAVRRQLCLRQCGKPAPSKSPQSRPCAINATFYGRNLTPSTSPTCNPDGHPPGAFRIEAS